MDTKPMDRKDFFLQLRKKYENEQFQNFCSELKEKMSRMEYVCLYLNTFLGKFLSMKIAKEKFDDTAHVLINNISLCHEENGFFHQLVDYRQNENYIDGLINLYHETKNLDKCQLGENMLKCLEASKKTTITE